MIIKHRDNDNIIITSIVYAAITALLLLTSCTKQTEPYPVTWDMYRNVGKLSTGEYHLYAPVSNGKRQGMKVITNSVIPMGYVKEWQGTTEDINNDKIQAE